MNYMKHSFFFLIGSRCNVFNFSLALLCIFVFTGACTSVTERDKWFEDKERTETNLLEYDSGIGALAGEQEVDGTMYFKVFRAPPGERENVRIRTCVLQHGYGMVQGNLNFKSFTYGTFVDIYYSEAMIKRLLGVCQEVIVPMQESNHTTILEMTLRTEKFLREVACRPILSPPAPGASGPRETCAFIGHSKGGAVAFNIARRCMQQTSSMGEAACKALAEIYSAAGVIQGSSATFTVYGAYLREQNDTNKLFTKVLGFGLHLLWDSLDEYTPGKTNPTWIDLSPAAPMEKGVPLKVINDIVLLKTGWLRADFAASTTKFRFTGGRSQKLHGCGEGEVSKFYLACRSFGNNLSLLHRGDLRPMFEEGLAAVKKDPRFKNPLTGGYEYLEDITWETKQTGDGLADFKHSIGGCQKGLASKSPDKAVKACLIHKDLNHLANAGGISLRRSISLMNSQTNFLRIGAFLVRRGENSGDSG